MLFLLGWFLAAPQTHGSDPSYGTRVAYCHHKRQYFVSSPKEQHSQTSDKVGLIHIYQFPKGFSQSKKIFPPDYSTTQEFGRAFTISSDCSRLIVGAPDVNEVHIYDAIEGEFKLSFSLTPKNDRYTSFGELIAASPNGRAFASRVRDSDSFRVLIYELFSTAWKESGDLATTRLLNNSIYASDLQFVDSSTLLVGIDDDSVNFNLTAELHKRSLNGWGISQYFPSPYGIKKNTTRFGKQISMPPDNRKIVAVTSDSSLFILTKSADLQNWSPQPLEIVDIEGPIDDVHFCDTNLFAVSQSSIRRLSIFERDLKGHFQQTEVLEPRASDAPFYEFASDFSFSENCNRLIVGAKSKLSNTSGKIYLFQKQKGANNQWRRSPQYYTSESVKIGLIITGSIFLVLLGVWQILLSARNRRMRLLTVGSQENELV